MERLLTTSHAYLTWRLAPAPAAPWAVAGAVAPDAVAIVAGVTLAGRGHRGPELLRRVYQQGAAARITTVMHSALAPSAVLSGHPGPRRFAFAVGWAGHLAIDYLSHHSDAWPPLFPLSGRRFASPVSYWQSDHHARALSAVEAAGLAALALTDGSRWRRAVGLLAAVIAALPALFPRFFAAHEDALVEIDRPAEDGDRPAIDP